MILSRRKAVGLAAAACMYAGPQSRFRLAICSETFGGASFPEICASARRTGYSGLEIDPANLSDDPASLSPGQRRKFRQAMDDAGISYAGMHSFLKTPKNLHLTTPDDAARRRSWEYFARLIELSADLGPDSVMVLGSSKQRSAIGGSTVHDATARLEEGLAKMAPKAAQRGVTILLEPLSPNFTNVVNTMAAAVGIVKRIGSPGLSSMLDTHNLTAETEPASALVAKHLPHIRHIHLNELDGRYPGSGNYPFAALLNALRRNGFNRWLSVELFDFQPDGETVARKSAEYVRALETEAILRRTQ